MRLMRLVQWLRPRLRAGGPLARLRAARHDVPSAAVGVREGHVAVRLLGNPDDARAFLRRDLPLWAWPLCTLGPREWPFVRLWADGAPAGGPAEGATRQASSGIWVFDHPAWGGSLQAFGDQRALAEMLRSVPLPGRAFVRMLPSAEGLLTARYRFDWLEPIVRMHVTPDTLVLPPEVEHVERLGQVDAHGLAALYAIWPESRFQTSRLRQGYQYMGIRRGGRIVAVAEQVLAAPNDDLAVVQGVLVEPAYRGRGWGGAVTAALTARLFENGARDVVLDVRESNIAAQAAYGRIGYRPHATLLAGPGNAR
jgi:ribosomal protein S18 acetylase RimI-like enzyme